MRRAETVALLAAGTAVAFGVAPVGAAAAVPHTVLPGETLWSIAAANNFTTRTVATFNGVAEDAQVIAGQTIEIPTESEGAAALAASSYVSPDLATASATTEGADPGSAPLDPTVVAPAPGMGHVPSPWGPLHLDPVAADAWNAMRVESLRLYGIDLHPNGPLSAHRNYAQQAHLYDLFLSGQGAPANPPGTSSHEYGAAVDVATPEMRWAIDQIGGRFGWSKVHAPGEWWHVDYVAG